MSTIEKIPSKTKGGARINSGRKPGSPNKKTAEVQKRIAETGITPLDYLLMVMRDPGGEPKERINAAVAAAPYVHAKLSAIDLSGSVKLGVTIMATPLDERL